MSASMLTSIQLLQSRHDTICRETRALDVAIVETRAKIAQLSETAEQYAAQDIQTEDLSRALSIQLDDQNVETDLLTNLVANVHSNVAEIKERKRAYDSVESASRAEWQALAAKLHDAVVVAHSSSVVDKLKSDVQSLILALEARHLHIARLRAELVVAEEKRAIERHEIEASATAAAEETAKLMVRLDTVKRQKSEIQLELKERHLFSKLLAARDELENEYFEKLHRAKAAQAGQGFAIVDEIFD